MKAINFAVLSLLAVAACQGRADGNETGQAADQGVDAADTVLTTQQTVDTTIVTQDTTVETDTVTKEGDEPVSRDTLRQ